jgi:hypothetical protein
LNDMREFALNEILKKSSDWSKKGVDRGTAM